MLPLNERVQCGHLTVVTCAADPSGWEGLFSQGPSTFPVFWLLAGVAGLLVASP